MFQISIAGKRGTERWGREEGGGVAEQGRGGGVADQAQHHQQMGGWGERGERGMITPSLVNSQRSGRRGD